MTTPEGAIFDLLTGNGVLSGLIGRRIYRGAVPRSAAMPYVSYQRVSKWMPRHLLGPSPLAHMRLQLTCWGRSAAEASEVANAVRLAIDGLRGETVGQTEIVTVSHEIETDGFTDPSDSSRNADYFSRCDYIVKYQEQVPAYI